MTIPRELAIAHAGNDVLVTSVPVAELSVLDAKAIVKNDVTIDTGFEVASSEKYFPAA